MPTSRSRWYSRSVRVSAGATVIESPVCTPMGSRFSIEQTTTTLSSVVAHHLELVLLPALDRLLEEHLGGGAGLEAGAGHAAQLGLVVGEAGAEPTHREGGSHDHRVAELVGGGEALVHRVRDDRAGALGAAALDDALEQLAVLAELDRLDVGADERAAVLLEDTRSRAARSRS